MTILPNGAFQGKGKYKQTLKTNITRRIYVINVLSLLNWAQIMTNNQSCFYNVTLSQWSRDRKIAIMALTLFGFCHEAKSK